LSGSQSSGTFLMGHPVYIDITERRLWSLTLHSIKQRGLLKLRMMSFM